jgi:hypothetical protein
MLRWIQARIRLGQGNEEVRRRVRVEFIVKKVVTGEVL